MIELTQPIQEALDGNESEPLRLVDPRTKTVYVLLPSTVYDRARSLLDWDDDLDGIDVGRLIADNMREDDDHDPLLESYQKYKDVP